MSESVTRAHLSERLSRLSPLGSRSSREEILNVFTPASPITSAARFVGRAEALEQMIDAVLAEGASLLVFGERGCGKSSLANMLHNVARRDFEILVYYGLRERLEKGV